MLWSALPPDLEPFAAVQVEVSTVKGQQTVRQRFDRARVAVQQHVAGSYHDRGMIHDMEVAAAVSKRSPIEKSHLPSCC